MRDDLISRKDLITEMEINIGNIYNPDIIKGMKFAIELIKSRPTAFDKGKVIEEILNGSHGYYNVETENEIVEIVEKGGIE